MSPENKIIISIFDASNKIHYFKISLSRLVMGCNLQFPVYFTGKFRPNLIDKSYLLKELEIEDYLF